MRLGVNHPCCLHGGYCPCMDVVLIRLYNVYSLTRPGYQYTRIGHQMTNDKCLHYIDKITPNLVEQNAVYMIYTGILVGDSGRYVKDSNTSPLRWQKGFRVFDETEIFIYYWMNVLQHLLL